MRDLTGMFFDGGSMARPDDAAICLPDGKFGEVLVGFSPDCFDPATGDFRPEIKAVLLALATDAPLPDCCDFA